MKNYYLNIKSVAILILLITSCSLTTSAQMRKKVIKKNNTTTSFKGCPTTLAEKTGEVFSVAPGILLARATSDEVTIKLKKTGGRAETQVNIYVNGRFTKKIEFDNGNYRTAYKVRTLTNVKGKNIKVEIVNQSVANTFSYTAKIEGFNKSIVKGGGAPITGVLAGQIKKSITTTRSCTGKTRVIVRRTSGDARATIRVFTSSGHNGWSSNAIKSLTFERNETKKIFIVNANKKLKIELKNISVGNLLGYKMNTLAVE